MSTEPSALRDPLERHSLSATELRALLSAQRKGTPLVALRDHDGTLRTLALPDDGISRLGRRGEMDLAIAWDGEVSGLHAELQSIRGEVTIVDDGLSTNGTFVNGHRINGRQRLRDGDRIRVGRTILAFRCAPTRHVPATVTANETDEIPLTAGQRRVLVALCRPLHGDVPTATPATNNEIADEVHLSIDTVKMHLRALFAKFGLSALPQNEKRVQLAYRAITLGIISPHERS
jgi:pSer/pThr/pTyr-binding forkhead associated (FHA) protein